MMIMQLAGDPHLQQPALTELHGEALVYVSAPTTTTSYRAAVLCCCCCCRSPDALSKLQCLQQQALLVNNPQEAAADHSNRVPSSWDELRSRCLPVLNSLAAAAEQNASSSSPRHHQQHL